jgi:MoaA/NifB/PqqE/SkfB family radical SAM enzyme
VTQVSLIRKLRSSARFVRRARMVARGLKSRDHPILAQVVPVRRCNLACAYCNEFDNFSKPVPAAEMLRRIDLLAALGTGTITISGGEPLLHPELDEIIRRIRSHGIIATLISNAYLLTPERIKRLNRAGLEYLQVSIDNLTPDEVSKKSLKVLDLKLRWLKEYAEFDVIINSVLGSGIRSPQDALVIARRARALGFDAGVGIIHDRQGQLIPLDEQQRAVHEQILQLGKGSFLTSAYYKHFQTNLVRGLPNDWQCRAGSRFLYICEDGLVHWCSQQRGYPGIPLERYTREDIAREYNTKKPCAPYCTITCVHQTGMIDFVRERPREALAGFFPPAQTKGVVGLPAAIKVLTWLFPPETRGLPTGMARRLFRAAAMKFLGLD